MSHHQSLPNPEAKRRPVPPEKLKRGIELLSRYWVDNDMALSNLQETRFATHKAYLVNELGLLMLEEDRIKEGLRPLQIHHLPVQQERVVANAIAKLSEREIQEGVAGALKALVDKHPFQHGGLPKKPGWTRSEAKIIGIKAGGRDGDGRALWELVLEVISERWLSSHEWAVMKNSARLASDIEVLVSKGYEISVDMRVNSDTGRKYAAYRYFTDPAERAAWEADQAQLEFYAKEKAAREEEAAKAERIRKNVEAKVAKKAKSLTSNSVKYGGWNTLQQPAAMPKIERQFFTAPPPLSLVPKAPPANVQSRLAALAGAGKGAALTVEVESQPGVPAEALNKAYPTAKSRDEVTFYGNVYRRRFRICEENGRRVAWHASWELVGQVSAS